MLLTLIIIIIIIIIITIIIITIIIITIIIIIVLILKVSKPTNEEHGCLLAQTWNQLFKKCFTS